MLKKNVKNYLEVGNKNSYIGNYKKAIKNYDEAIKNYDEAIKLNENMMLKIL